MSRERAADLALAHQLARRVVDNVERVIVGRRRQVEFLVAAILAEGHVLIEDVPGTGKTMLARALAVSSGLTFKRVQCTPDLLPNDVTGVNVFDQRSGDFSFRPGPVFTNILLADEVNRATPRTQAALLEAMQERQVTADGVTRPLDAPFVVLATQNPVEYEGTFPLPEAQLDRFLLRLSLGYLDLEDEARMMTNLRGRHPIDDLEPVVDGRRFPELAEAVSSVHLENSLERHVLTLVRATREHADVALGASARACLALARCARALAAVDGRDFVTPDHVKELAPLVIAHRLVLRPESQLRGRTAVDVVADIVEGTGLRLDATG